MTDAPSGLPPGVRRGTETVLLVEDDAGVRQAGMRLLQRLGYTVLTAPDGEEALRCYREHAAEIALVITDIDLPKLDGWQLRAEVRKTGAAGGAVRFLFVSGEPINQTNDRDGATSFLAKPWTLPELATRVREVLDR